MAPFIAAQTTALNLANAILGAACLALLVAVAVAVGMDVRERRRWRAMVPDAWPPTGVHPADAYAADAADEPAPSAPGRREP